MRNARMLPPAGVRRRELVRWRNAVFAIFWLSGLVLSTWASRVPTVRDLLHASTAQMGLLIFALAAGSIAGLLGASHLIARIGSTTAIIVCYPVAAAGSVIVGFATSLEPTIAGIAIGLAVLGAGSSIVDVAMNLSGAANERALGRPIMPLFHASFSIGTVTGAGIGVLTILANVPMVLHLGAVGVLAVVTTLVLGRFLRPAEPRIDGAPREQHGGWRSRLAVWSRPRVLLIGLIVLGMAFAEGSANDWLALAMVDGHRVSDAVGAATYGVFVAAMTAARIGGVAALGRFGRVTTLRASAALTVIGLLLVVVVPSTAVAIAGVVLWGLGAALGFPVGMSAAADDPRTATATVAAVSTIGYLAFLVGPPAIGSLGQRVGLLHALVAVLVLVVVSGLASGAARPTGPSSGVGTGLR